MVSSSPVSSKLLGVRVCKHVSAEVGGGGERSGSHREMGEREEKGVSCACTRREREREREREKERERREREREERESGLIPSLLKRGRI